MSEHRPGLEVARSPTHPQLPATARTTGRARSTLDKHTRTAGYIFRVRVRTCSITDMVTSRSR